MYACQITRVRLDAKDGEEYASQCAGPFEPCINKGH
jgi:hypothetical protein